MEKDIPHPLKMNAKVTRMALSEAIPGWDSILIIPSCTIFASFFIVFAPFFIVFIRFCIVDTPFCIVVANFAKTREHFAKILESLV